MKWNDVVAMSLGLVVGPLVVSMAKSGDLEKFPPVTDSIAKVCSNFRPILQFRPPRIGTGQIRRLRNHFENPKCDSKIHNSEQFMIS